MCVLSVVLPSWPSRHQAVVLSIGLVALTVAAAVARAGRSVTHLMCHALVAAGAALIAALMIASGGGAASATFATFYVWIGVYCFVFFPPVAAAGHVVLVGVCEAIALVQVGDGGQAPAQLTISLGTVLATGAVVGVLAARLHALAATDWLTGLPGRRALDAVLRERLTGDRRRSPVAVLAIDLDGFKGFNDTYGHGAGDELLQRLATAWAVELRHDDVLARSGGDEFFTVLNNCDEVRASRVAQRLVQAVGAPVSACVGAVVVPACRRFTHDNVAHVLRQADQALYAGKAQGPGNVVVAVWMPPGFEGPHDDSVIDAPGRD